MKIQMICLMCSAMMFAVGCGDEQVGAAAPAGVGKTVVVGDGQTTVYDTPAGDGCIEIGSECVSPQKECGDNARADVIVDAQGEYIDTVCYPGDDVTHDEHKGSVKPDDDGATVVLDGDDDGEDITDNVEFKGNDSVLYGQGEEVSVIGGNLKVIGNNAAIRGVRIKGSVDLEGNDGRLTSCVIEGNLHIKGNGNMVADCVVFGDINADYSEATNTTLSGNFVQKRFRAGHESSQCSGNYAFADENENLQLEQSEIEDDEPLTCPTE